MTTSPGGPPAFGELLLRHRRAAGLSQKALAQRSGMSERAVRELERGRARAAQRRSAEVLADALELTGAARAEFLEVARESRRRAPEPVAAAGLPPLPSDLTGREEVLRQLREHVSTRSAVAVVGQAGVGKTVLVAVLAEQLRDEFPDGCFAVDLRGVDEQPLSAHAVFERLLRAMGVPQNEIPPDEVERSGAYREVLSTRRVLVLLDNAADEAQVRPLLSTPPGCRTLITCRRILSGLEEVRWLHLEPLGDDEAVALLGAIVGDRVREAPGDAADIAALCGNLPLALRIAGNRLASKPDWSLRYLVGQLDDERTRLTSLSAGDLHVRSAFEVSYRRLSPPGRTLFRRLAAVPGADFGLELVRSVGEVAQREALLHLRELVETSMVLVSPVAGRFRFHDLIRIFAREQWEAEEPEAERERVREGMFRTLLSRATAAGEACFPNNAAEDGALSYKEAVAWLDQEVSNWQAAVEEAARRGWHREALRLAKSMHWYSDDHWYSVPWEEIFLIGVDAARALGDRSSEAQQLSFVGWALRAQPAALGYYEQALEVAVEAGDELEQTWALAYIGAVHNRRGDRVLARKFVAEAAERSGRFDFWDVQMAIRFRYGDLLLDLGEVDEALAVLRDLVAAAGAYRTPEMPQTRHRMIGVATEATGLCLHAMGRCGEAAEVFARVGATYVENGSLMLQSRVAYREGRCLVDAGDHDRAAVVLERALAGFEQLSMPEDGAAVRAELARLPRRQG
ncbi:Predicted ATPase [Lentzea fradiae]|uniref:Predicted ATPase n=1 Tax=Lentzea fradiae TaxID=200378 RepID=A0A1G7UP81_9PSEU|nr:XRE family transcriptional regulator [Lentzea fradiae]SDG49405.1 Predicted ATPase [Lentzea fradiae]